MRAVWIMGIVGAITVSAASAAETGVVQTWSSGTTAGWFSQVFPTNPGTGGVDGAGDGFLLMERTAGGFAGPLGVHARDKAEVQAYLGDYTAAGVASVTAWFRNFGDTPIEMHVGIASGQFGGGGRYMSTLGATIPIGGGWTKATFELDGAAFEWIGFENPPSETFEQTMANVSGLVFRHDTAPFSEFPVAYIGSVGMDNVVLNAGCTPLPGDFDCDGDVDLFDFSAMLDCTNGPGGGVAGGCEPFDFDADADVDWADAWAAQRAFTGAP